MAAANLGLNVTANTSRALSEFKKFSASLDNKFLISGLKLDVVRSSLAQINREFQKSIGEQGLASASTFRAAQNQAAILTQTFKGFAFESALAINKDIGTALNNIVIKTGGTMADVRKVMAATPFIDRNIASNLRDSLTRGLIEFQTNARRAGLGDSFGGLAKQFLSGRTQGRDLINSDDPMAQFLGAEIIKRSGGQAQIFGSKARSEIMEKIVGDQQLMKQLKEMAKMASGYKIVLEDLSTQLFNTETGVFGSLRKVIDRTGRSTTIFDEVDKLVQQVFGPNGTFRELFNSLNKVFGIGDPLRLFIDAIQFVTARFKDIQEFVKSEMFMGALSVVKQVFDRVYKIFLGIISTFQAIFTQISSGGLNASDVTQGIKTLGSSIRGYIEEFGESIRSTKNDDKVAGFVADIGGTILAETGKTLITVFKEVLMTLIDKVPSIVGAVLPALNNAINEILTSTFGAAGAGLVKFIAGFVPGPVGMIARASAAGDITGGGGSMGSMAAMGAAALVGPAAIENLMRLGINTRRMGGANISGGIVDRFGMIDDRLNASRASLGLDPRYDFRNRSTEFLRFGRSFDNGPGTPIRAMYNIEAGREFVRQNELNRLVPRYNIQAGRDFIRENEARRNSGQIPPTGGYNIEAGREFVRQNERNRTTSEINRNLQEARDRIAAASRPAGGVTDSLRRLGIRSATRRRYYDSRLNETSEPWLYENSLVDAISEQGGQFAGDPDGARASLDRVATTRAKELDRRYRRRYGLRGRIRRSVGRIGKFGKIGALAGIGLAGIGLFGGGGAQASEVDEFGMPQTPRPGLGDALGGVASGAMTGASIGSIIPGIGTGVGAAVGGVIGGILPFMEEGTMEGVKEFVAGIGTWLTQSATFISTTIGNTIKSFTDMIGNIFKTLGNAMIMTVNSVIGMVTALPSGIVAMIKSLPGIDMIPGIQGLLDGASNVFAARIPQIGYNGSNYFGPAMGLEARMSGRRPLVVNDGEFVIPSNGLATLAGLMTSVAQPRSSQSSPPIFNITFQLTTNSMVANPDEMVAALEGPVIQIINDAWVKSSQTNIRRSNVS